MKKLTFDYYMQIDYSETVSSCHFTIKCLPKDTLRQRAGKVTVQLSPNVPYSTGTDSFGNGQIYGWDDVEHTTFSFRITGVENTGLAGPMWTLRRNRRGYRGAASVRTMRIF